MKGVVARTRRMVFSPPIPLRLGIGSVSMRRERTDAAEAGMGLVGGMLAA